MTFRLLRVKHYIKNLFVFLPLFFGAQFAHGGLVIRAAVVFVAFCLMASAAYILNDILDRAEDQNHPKKSKRPIASGQVKPFQAVLIASGLFLGSVVISATVGIGALFVLVAYGVLNLLYSLKLKHVPVLDVVMIAIGFVLRVLAGAIAVHIVASMWLILLTFLLALFLGLAKRRDDVLLSQEGLQTRRCIDGYNLEFVNASMVMMASVVVVSYIFYTISPEVQLRFHTDYLYLTVVYVVVGVMRYMQLTFVEERSGNPTSVLWRDGFLQLTLGAWVATFALIIYLHR
ncbi:MAG: decaprenyl-phosphate phosphoribosyltransferase [Candidatus Margulisiibacteriota bacterium]